MIICSLISCEKDYSTIPFITKFNVEAMADMHLPDFELIRARPRYRYGKDYLYKRESDNAYINISIGLHQSAEEAEIIAEYFINNSISAHMEEGPHQGVSIGDKYWLSSPYDANNYNDIIFIRKNVFITIFSPEYENLKILTTNIDNDILNNASYINCIN